MILLTGLPDELKLGRADGARFLGSGQIVSGDLRSNGFGDAEKIAHKHRVLDEWCTKVGRDPMEIERSAGVSAKHPARSAESLYAVGTRLFTVGLGGPEYDLGPVQDLLAWRDQRNKT